MTSLNPLFSPRPPSPQPAPATNEPRRATSPSREDGAARPGVVLRPDDGGLLRLTEPRREAERLAQARQPAHRLLAMLWLAIGDPAQATPHALAAYKEAWADGEPYVFRYELTQSAKLLRQLDVPIPVLPPYDPGKDEKFPWEATVAAAIEKLRAENEAKKQKQGKPD